MAVVQSAASLRKNDRFWIRRSVLLLALIPLAVVAYRLADLPGPPMDSEFSDDGSLLLTSTFPAGPRNLEQQGDHRVLSLESGKMLRVSAVSGQMIGNECVSFTLQPDKTFRIQSIDRRSFQLRDLGNVAFDEKDVIAFSPDGLFARVRANQEFIVTDLQSGSVATAPMPAFSGPLVRFWRVNLKSTPSRCLVSEVSTGAVGRKEQQLLFAFEHDELKQLAEWTSIQISLVQEDRLLSWTVDHVLEIRNLADGSLIESHPLKSQLELVPGSVTWLEDPGDPGLVRIGIRAATGNQSVIYDYHQRRIVARFSSANELLQEVQGGSVSLVNDKAQKIVVRRLSDQSLVREWDLPQKFRSVKFMDDDDRHIAVLFNDDSVRIYDVASGDCLRVFRDRSWVVPMFAAVVLGFVAWNWLWVKQSLQHGISPIWDVVAMHSAILAGLLMRVFLYTGNQSPFSPIFVGCEALSVGWGTFAMGWCYFGRARWSVRAVAPFIAGAAGLLVGMAMFRQVPEGIVGFAFALIAITGLIGFMFWLVRRWAWRLVTSMELERLVASPADRIRLPLRDLFSLTFGFAVLLAVTRFVPFARLQIEIIGELCLIAAAAAAAAVVAWWGALDRRHLLLRVVAVILVPIAASFIISTGKSWHAWREVAGFTLSIAASVWFSCWLFRLRGWRFVRTGRTGATIDGKSRSEVV